MGLFDKLNPFASEARSVRDHTVHAYDSEDTVLDPSAVTDVSDILTVRVEFDNGDTVEIKQTFGQWHCITCTADCRHEHEAEKLMNEWARLNTQ